MGSLYAKDVVDTALSEVGYQADGKWNKFADVLDSVDYFTGCGNKQGLDWCCVFVCYCAYMNTRNSDGDIDPDVWDAHYFLYQSDSCDMAAVVKYLAQYFKDNDAWTDNPERGDVCIFQKSNGVYYHTGVVTDWDNEAIYVTEGNTGGGQVLTREYSYKDIGGKIAGFGRPRYDGWEMSTSEEPVNEPEPEPTPKPAPDKPAKSVDELANEVIAGKWGNGKDRANRLEEAGYDYQAVQNRVNEILGINKPSTAEKHYTVSVNTKLNVRYGASMDYPIKYQLDNGDPVTVYETDGNWGRIGDEEWVCMDYLV